MRQPIVLIVEDNAVTRKMMRIALANEGYAVLQAPDGRTALDTVRTRLPDLIIQDLVLPDMSGFDLVQQLRAVSGVNELPIIACSGFIAKLDEVREVASGFTDYLVKPVAPSRLLEVIRSYLPLGGAHQENLGAGRRVLLADDDAVQRKLAVIRLRQLGFEATGVANGLEVLEIARVLPPDAIVSDVLMPELDGFQLCLAIRQDPALKHLPVVLATSSYLEPEDKELARRVGASAFVVRSPDLGNVVEALLSSLSTTEQPASHAAEVVDQGYAHRIIRQLEHQSAMNSSLAQRCSLQAAELAVLSGISDALTRHEDTNAALTEVLQQCLDAGGLSHGILYLLDRNSRLALHTGNGYGAWERLRLESFFGHREFLDRVIAAGNTVTLPSRGVPEAVSGPLLSQAGARSALIVPLISREERLGALVLVASDEHLAEGEWFAFAQTVGAQIAQAVALTRTISQLSSSEQRYRGLMKNANDAIFVLDRQSRLMEVNHCAETMLARTRSSLVGCDFAEVCDLRKPDAQRRLAELLAAETGTFDEISMLRSNGTSIPAEISTSIVRIDNEPAVLVIARDVTERKDAEEALRQSQEQLRQAQKMEAIGRLAGGIAHDFNNMLTAMSAYAEILKEGLDHSDPKREDVREIVKAVDRAASLTRQLLAFSRQQMLQPRILDLNTTVSEMENMLRRLVSEDIELVTQLGQNLGSVRADPGQVEQVLMNLVVNARDAMPNGGTVRIETANVHMDDAAAKRHAPIGVPPGRYVRLAVSDTGIGMDETTRAQIFEPFFTTKAKGHGTGLGLSTVYGIVKQSESFIWCYSEPGRGTTFKIYLPQVDAPVDAPAGGRRRSGAHRGTETVLLVEDDHAVRSVTRRILSNLGYTVLEANNGAEALRLCSESSTPISLIVSDMVMPEMGGPELARQLRASKTDIRMLFMSGYTEDASRHHNFLEPGMAFIDKPFSPSALAEKIREVLEDSGAGVTRPVA